MLDQTEINDKGTTKSFNHKGASCRVRIFSSNQARVTSVFSRNRGNGEARELLEKVCAWADEHGTDLFLTVQQYGKAPHGPGNDILEAFYSSLGFEPNGDGKKPLLMWRDSR